MSDERRCARCGSMLPTSSPGAQCPRCLLQLACDDTEHIADADDLAAQSDASLGSTTHSVEPGSLVSPLARLGFVVAVTAFLLIAAVQLHDAIVWATTPWLGFTLGDGGRILVRDRSEVPSELGELYERHTLRAVAVATDADWVQLTTIADQPPYQVWSRTRAPWERLCAALRDVTPGAAITLRIATGVADTHELRLRTRQLPARLMFERTALYAGLGLAILAVGAGVLRARPASGQALALAVLTACFGGQLLTTQVAGGFPSRFYWLSLIGCYATPAAAAVLALTLEPVLWWPKRRWVLAVPWIGALSGGLLATVRGDLLHDSNIEVSVLRAAGWLFFAGYISWARWRTTDRWKRRSFEYYLGGMAITFSVPTWHYVQLRALGESVSPWVMAPLTLFPLIIGYGVLRNRLFDAEVVLRRGLSLTALMFVAAVVWGMLAAIASVVVGTTQPAASPLWMAIFAAVALALGGTLRPRLQALVDRGVNPTRYRYLETLRRASDEIASLDDPVDVAERLVRIAMTEVNLPGAAVFLRDRDGFFVAASGGLVHVDPECVLEPDEPIVALTVLVGSEFHISDFAYNPRLASLRGACVERMNTLGIDLILPLQARSTQLVGLLALASRVEGAPLNAEDLELVKVIVAQASHAIARSSDLKSKRQHAVLRPQPGLRFGHYLLEERIAVGGMGAIYRARDERLDRLVALKFINEDRTADGSMLERLQREARTLATLNHPGIMHIFALEEVDGHWFLAVELLLGRTLRAELEQRGTVPSDEVIDLSLAMADALGYALANDIIHRDIKLDNVMRTTTGTIKLMDFGLAKLIGVDDPSLTKPGHVVGTPAYLAPELLTGEQATFRSDMYALGVALHALLTGRDLWTRLDATRKQPLVPDDLSARGVPEPWIDPLMRLLQVEPLARYADYAELRADLESTARRL